MSGSAGKVVKIGDAREAPKPHRAWADYTTRGNGERQRDVGNASSIVGVRRLARSVAEAGQGWGVRLHGSETALRALGAYKVGGSYFELELTSDKSIACEEALIARMAP